MPMGKQAGIARFLFSSFLVIDRVPYVHVFMIWIGLKTRIVKNLETHFQLCNLSDQTELKPTRTKDDFVASVILYDFNDKHIPLYI